MSQFTFAINNDWTLYVELIPDSQIELWDGVYHRWSWGIVGPGGQRYAAETQQAVRGRCHESALLSIIRLMFAYRGARSTKIVPDWSMWWSSFFWSDLLTAQRNTEARYWELVRQER